MNDFQRNYGGAVAGTRGVAIDEGLRQYMLGVYNYMALAVAATGLVSFFVASNPALVMGIAKGPLLWVIFFGILGIGMFAPRIIFSGSKAAAHGLFWAYAGAWGLLIAPMLYSFRIAGAEIEVYRAFFITAAVFGSMSLFGYVTKRDLSGLGSFFFMASIGLVVAIIVNAIFFHSTMASLVTSGLVVLLFSGVTAYETQMIKSLYTEGGAMNERASIFGAFALYGSFITLFVHILNILGIMRNN
ncbi:MAG: Bax inhibitor-1/YccA family protein [Parvularculaceae bacterium]|nr:Bax inhibitor-1/YccA family protein [Amphiplicatus sp.]MCB9955109.1 Bax inhibitor-1/YccA family protein [Caulobacterales bacterium]HRX37996.1 Bax inhibitor-1/YccA family protein [Parvularculaceae bacterium]